MNKMRCLRLCLMLIAGFTLAGCGGSATVTPKDAGRKATSVDLVPADSVRLIDDAQDEKWIDPLNDPQAKAIVLVFVSTTCPIANRYAPELQRLAAVFSERGVKFWLVYVDRDETLEQIRAHRKEYRYQIPALADFGHKLVELTGATRTPEAVVFTAGRQQQYRGRIDDRFTDYGKSRASASQQDLKEALEALLAGTAVKAPTTTVVGCPISSGDLPGTKP